MALLLPKTAPPKDGKGWTAKELVAAARKNAPPGGAAAAPPPKPKPAAPKAPVAPVDPAKAEAAAKAKAAGDAAFAQKDYEARTTPLASSLPPPALLSIL